MDEVKWYHFGMGITDVGNTKTGRWEYILDGFPHDRRTAMNYLMNRSFTFDEAEDYLDSLLEAWYCR